MDWFVGFLIIVGLFVLIKTNIGLNRNPKSPMYKWHLKDDFNINDGLIPWKQVFKCQISKKTWDDFEAPFKEELSNLAYMYFGIQNLNASNIIIVDYRTPKASWAALAGRSGYLFILKDIKKQLHFRLTAIS